MIICYWFCLLKDVQKYDAKVSCNNKKKKNEIISTGFASMLLFSKLRQLVLNRMFQSSFKLLPACLLSIHKLIASMTNSAVRIRFAS